VQYPGGKEGGREGEEEEEEEEGSGIKDFREPGGRKGMEGSEGRKTGRMEGRIEERKVREAREQNTETKEQNTEA
jgi:hypothetical protein